MEKKILEELISSFWVNIYPSGIEKYFPPPQDKVDNLSFCSSLSYYYFLYPLSFLSNSSSLTFIYTVWLLFHPLNIYLRHKHARRSIAQRWMALFVFCLVILSCFGVCVIFLLSSWIIHSLTDVFFVQLIGSLREVTILMLTSEFTLLCFSFLVDSFLLLLQAN